MRFHFRPIFDDEQTLRRQMIEQRGGLRVKVLQIKFDPGKAATFGERLAVTLETGFGDGMTRGQIPGSDGGGDRAPAAGQCLARRREHHRFERVRGALCCRIKGAQRIHFVAEKFDAHRLRIGGRPHVQDAAAPAERARRLDDGLIVVTERAQRRQKFGEVGGFAAAQHAHPSDKLSGGHSLLHRRAHRGDDDRRRVLRERGERGKSRGNRIRAPGNPLVKQGIRFGKIKNVRAVRRPDVEFARELLGAIRARRENDQRDVERARQGEDQRRARRFDHVGGERRLLAELARHIFERVEVFD